MRYTLDSNILINMERLYPCDIFGALWERMEELAHQGQTCICEQVLKELGRGTGDLETWVKQLDSFVCRTQQDEIIKVAEISKAAPTGYAEKRTKPTLG